MTSPANLDFKAFRIEAIKKSLLSIDFNKTILKNYKALSAKRKALFIEYLELKGITYKSSNECIHIRIYDENDNIWFNIWPTVSKLHEIGLDGDLEETIGFERIFTLLKDVGETKL